MSSVDYEVPDWSGDGEGEFYFEVLKDGSIVDNIKLLNKQFFILGRQPDIVDIQMDHPSISRKHAVLNFRNDGALMIRDLGSGQGTFLNKKRCDKDIYYRVYVGDMIKFGSSTRQYILNGPEDQRPPEYESVNLIEMRAKMAQKSADLLKKKEEQENEGIGWGFREDAVNPQYEDDEEEKEVELPDYLKKQENFDRKFGEKFDAGITNEEAKNEKDRVILDKIRKKELKIQNMQEEIRRIYMKEGNQDDGLTDGQIKAVARNDEQIKRLTDDIEELVHTIKSKNIQRAEMEKREKELEEGAALAGANRKRILENMKQDDIEFDTTSATADVNTNWRLRKKMAKLQQKEH